VWAGARKNIMKNKKTEEPVKTGEEKGQVNELVMPKGEDYFVNHTVKAMILGGFESVKEHSTNGLGIVDLDALEGFLAGVVAAGLQIQEQINSYDKVDYNTGEPFEE
jgi:hypothetical protein